VSHLEFIEEEIRQFGRRAAVRGPRTLKNSEVSP
jgi:hypothetical protein